MWEGIRNWIKRHKLAAGFIIATIAVIIAFGIYAGLAWLTVEVFDIHPRWALRDRPETIGVTYHHTATPDRDIAHHHAFHQEVRGWNMVGYHFQVREDGTIEEGRPLHTTGAHAGPEGNPTTIGVVFSGDMSHAPPSEAQYDAAAELHYWLEEEYGRKLSFYKHSDWMSTACPGRHTELSEIEWRVQEWREGVRTPDDPVGVDERVRRQIEIEVTEGRVFGEPTSGYLIIEEGRVYVPIRWVAEELGYDISWDPDERVWEVK